MGMSQIGEGSLPYRVGLSGGSRVSGSPRERSALPRRADWFVQLILREDTIAADAASQPRGEGQCLAFGVGNPATERMRIMGNNGDDGIGDWLRAL
jgi:hypothetical protein